MTTITLVIGNNIRDIQFTGTIIGSAHTSNDPRDDEFFSKSEQKIYYIYTRTSDNKFILYYELVEWVLTTWKQKEASYTIYNSEQAIINALGISPVLKLLYYNCKFTKHITFI